MAKNENKEPKEKGSKYGFLVHLQSELLEAIQKNLFKIKTNIEEEFSKSWLQSRKTNFKEEMSSATTNNIKILSEIHLEDENIKKYVESKTFDKIRDCYCDLMAEIDEKLEPFLKATKPDEKSSNTSRVEPTLKLPKLDLPTFSGKYDEWLPFNNLFTARVHNNRNLDPVEKLHYLMGVVTGDAKLEIEKLIITDESYEIARDILDKQFNHPREVANTYMRKLIDVEPLASENASELRKFICNVKDCSASLKQLGLPVDNWGYILLYVLQTKIPNATYVKWGEELGASREIPELSKFLEFLEKRYRTLEMVQTSDKTDKEAKKSTKALHTKTNDQPSAKSTSKGFQKKKFQNKPFENKKTNNKSCALCNASDHSISRCKRFLNNTPQQRKQLAVQYKLCLNCLGSSHTSEVCYSVKTCVYCKQNHHSLLHIHDQANSAPFTPAGQTQTLPQAYQNPLPIKRPAAYHTSTNTTGVRVLPTALIQLINSSGFSTTVRILLDSAADENYITSSSVQRTGLLKQKYPVPSSITGLNEMDVGEVEFYVNFTLKSLDGSFEYKTHASVVENISSKLPAQFIDPESIGFLNNLTLADPQFNHPGQAHLLLGVSFVAHIKRAGVKRFNGLIAEQTLLGWVVMGQARPNKENDSTAVNRVLHTKMISNDDLSKQIKKFFEVEEVFEEVPKKPEDELAEQSFLKTVSRCDDGRLIFELPFRDGDPVIGCSRHIAEIRLINLEKKLERNPELKREYHQTFLNYLENGHLVPVTTNSYDGKESFLPHHAVVKMDSTTTKVRVVFDGSCRSADGTSLNDHLLTGPKLQQDIRDILFKWRICKVALTADIAKMYLMFWIAEKHRNYQKVLWRFSPQDPITEYALATVTFGTSSAPFQAMRALNYIAEQGSTKFPLASNSLLTEFYVDDLIAGAHTLTEAIQKQNELRELLSSYGLKIRKWSSNFPEVLEGITPEDRETLTELKFEEEGFRKTLGVFWAPTGDFFSFSTNKFLELGVSFTKRSILSVIARLYDPIGLVAPCTLYAKLIMQRIWEQNVGWDDEVCGGIKQDFQLFLKDLSRLSEIKIDRWINITDDHSPLTLYGFSDASSKAYGAVIYLKDPNDDTKLILLSCRTRVKPLKHTSLARLELCAAVMLAGLLKWAVKLLEPHPVQTYAFSDSKIVLSWLASHPSRWKTYVAARTHKILQAIPAQQWFYVNTKHNPADLASRGLLPSELIHCDLWWNGPNFEHIQITNSFENLTSEEQNHLLTEIKDTKTVLHSKSVNNSLTKLLEKISSHYKMCRVVQYVLNYLRINFEKQSALTSPNIKNYVALIQTLDAENCIFRIVQSKFFFLEIQALREQKALPKKSCLSSLNPFLDGFGVLRVGGRLQEALIPYNEKHPIILPTHHQVTTNLLHHAHNITIHGTRSETAAYIRQKFHIIRCNDRIKFLIRHCPRCIKFARHTHLQLMGTLPHDRVNPYRAFLNSGVDYAGPFTLKAYKGRCKIVLKYYVSLFVCFSSKALHLEIVSELTAAAFLAAFRRFVSRRGQCQRLYSDRGTNFMKGDKLLMDEVHRAELSWMTELKIDFESMGTSWEFNPPGAPHFGGLWEAGVKSFKGHLNKTLVNTLLTPEEFSTILIQIEGILNSRPLYRLNDDAHEFSYLTPAHFLIGESIVSPPERAYNCDDPQHPLDRWQYIQKLRQGFWISWRKNYLQNLNTRSKWKSTGIDFKINDLVILTDENYPPNVWPTAIILEAHPGRDGLTRVVTLKTQRGQILKRPVSKLRLLPIREKDEQKILP